MESWGRDSIEWVGSERGCGTESGARERSLISICH